MTVTLTDEMAEICIRALQSEQHKLGWCREQKVAKLAALAIQEAMQNDPPVQLPELEVDDTNPIGPVLTGKGW